MNAYDLVLHALAAYAYEYRTEPFQLASGAMSHEYLDCKRALSRPEVLPALGLLFLEGLCAEAEAVGGLTMGADPIAIATSYASAGTERPRGWIVVRKEPKKHGQRRLIEGAVQPNARIVIVDDVVTSGGSTIEAIRKCRESGLEVVQVLVLVDREEQDGIAKIRAEVASNVPVRALFLKSEIARARAR